MVFEDIVVRTTPEGQTLIESWSVFFEEGQPYYRLKYLKVLDGVGVARYWSNRSGSICPRLLPVKVVSHLQGQW